MSSDCQVCAATDCLVRFLSAYIYSLKEKQNEILQKLAAQGTLLEVVTAMTVRDTCFFVSVACPPIKYIGVVELFFLVT